MEIAEGMERNKFLHTPLYMPKIVFVACTRSNEVWAFFSGKDIRFAWAFVPYSKKPLVNKMNKLKGVLPT